MKVKFICFRSLCELIFVNLVKIMGVLKVFGKNFTFHDRTNTVMTV